MKEGHGLSVPQSGEQGEAGTVVVGVIVKAERVALTHDPHQRDTYRKALTKRHRRRALSKSTHVRRQAHVRRVMWCVCYLVQELKENVEEQLRLGGGINANEICVCCVSRLLMGSQGMGVERADEGMSDALQVGGSRFGYVGSRAQQMEQFQRGHSDISLLRAESPLEGDTTPIVS